MRRLLFIIIGICICAIGFQPVFATRIITPAGENIDFSFIKNSRNIIQEIKSLQIDPPLPLLDESLSASGATVAPTQPPVKNTANKAPRTLAPVQQHITAPAATQPVLPTIAQTMEYTLTIPRLNLYNILVTPSSLTDETNWTEALKHGVAQVMNNPGSGHKIVIFGHSSRYSWDKESQVLFRNLYKMVNGDRIYMTYQGKLYVYEVYKSERVAPNTPSITTDYNWEEAVLFTCFPLDAFSERYIVYTKPVS